MPRHRVRPGGKERLVHIRLIVYHVTDRFIQRRPSPVVPRIHIGPCPQKLSHESTKAQPLHLAKPDKGLLRCYLERTTGLSQSQLTRLIQRYLAAGRLEDRRQGAAKPFRCKYTQADIELLAETDELHGSLSGPATLVLLERAWEVFGDARFERLAGLSNGHLYNLRRSHTYRERLTTQQRTRPARVAIAERKRPQPEGRPGYVRVDSVH